MRNLIAIAASILTFVFVLALAHANADDASMNTNTTTKTETQRTVVKNSKTCTDKNGITYRKHHKGYDQCMQESKGDMGGIVGHDHSMEAPGTVSPDTSTQSTDSMGTPQMDTRPDSSATEKNY